MRGRRGSSSRARTHLPNKEPLQLGLAATVLLQLLGVGLQHAVHDGLQRALVADLHHAARLHQGAHAAIPFSRQQRWQNLLANLATDDALVYERNHLCQRCGRHGELVGRRARLVAVAHHVAHNPVGSWLGWRARGQHGIKECSHPHIV